MAQVEGQYAGNHRRQQSLAFVVSALGLLLAVVPRQERALFITDGVGLKAFAAEFPPIHPATLLDFAYNVAGPTGPLAFFARTPRPFAGPVGPGAFAPGQPGGAAPFAAAPDGGAPAGGGSPFAPPVAGGNPGSNLPISPAQFGVPNASPAVPAAPGTGVTTPVAAVPEPGTWLMMIVGLVAVGVVFRARTGSRHPVEAGSIG